MSTAQSELAVEKFVSGYNCSQSILFAFGPGLGLDPETALKIASCFGGGIGGSGQICGAVSGGILALGLKFGRGGREEKAVAQVAHKKALELMRAFEQVHSTCTCRSLLGGCDLTTAEGKQQFQEQGLHRKVCVGCVRTAGELLEGMLSDTPEHRGS
jgi:C_GCAxxG_C_C family probable redox protein